VGAVLGFDPAYGINNMIRLQCITKLTTDIPPSFGPLSVVTLFLVSYDTAWCQTCESHF